MNWVLIGITIALYPLCGADTDYAGYRVLLVLGEGRFGLIGHVLVHADWIHLLGNMYFLWLFGNAVCAKVGNGVYVLIYFTLGIVAGIAALVTGFIPSVGASGAINGIVGMFLVWFLLNEVDVFYVFFFEGGFFSVSSGWLILFWTVFDIWGLIQGGDHINYVAHLAGLVAGIGLAIALLKLNWVKMERGERSLLQVLWDWEDKQGEGWNRRRS
ncbi:MAG: rhomboid family intramembrane serine protease [Gemmataceae bacterium]|nr:rhomboid family intramembrane serine protease [Gemmataceae bacterium]